MSTSHTSTPISNIYYRVSGERIENPTATIATSNNAFLSPYISSVSLKGTPYTVKDVSAHNEIEELREMISKLTEKPYFMKIQCHNCGAPLVVESSNHLVKCKYCHTAYFSGTQLVNAI
jgi:ribosomal protein S27E